MHSEQIASVCHRLSSNPAQPHRLLRASCTRLLLLANATIALTISVPVMSTPIGDAVQFSDNGHYYQLFTTIRTWDNANWAAQQMGGYLATISSAAENNFVTSLLPAGFNAWLGGFQPPGSPEPAGSWQWITGEPFSYVNWNSGEPNNGVGYGVTDESALEIYGIVTDQLGKWNDARPDLLYFGYVVEYDTTPAGTPEPAGQPLPVPDGGESIGLLALGLVTVAAVRRFGPPFSHKPTQPPAESIVQCKQ